MRRLIFTACPDDASETAQFRTLPRVGGGLAQALRLAEDLPDWQVLVASDDQDILAQAANLGLEVLSLPRGDGPQGRPPACLSEALSPVSSPDDSLVIADWRNPDLDATIVREICLRMENSPGIWIGLSEPDDHPVQANIYLNGRSWETHVLADDYWSDRLGLRVSVPRYVESFLPPLSGADWENAPEELVLVRLSGGGFGRPPRLIPPDRSPADLTELVANTRRAVSKSGLVFLCGKDGVCRRVADPELPPEAVIPFGRAAGRALFTAIGTPDGQDLYCRRLQPGLHHLRIRTSRDRTDEPPERHWFGLTGSESTAFCVRGTDYVGPVIRRPDNRTDLLLHLDSQTLAGRADTSLPLGLENGGWKVTANGRRVNQTTGRSIAGRQDFPSLWEPDRTLVALPVGQDDRLPNFSLDAGVQGHVLPVGSSLRRALNLGLDPAILIDESSNADQRS